MGKINFYKLKVICGIFFIASSSFASNDINTKLGLIDTAFVNSLNNKAFKLNFTNVDSGIAYAQLAINYSKEINYNEGICFGYYNVAHGYWIKTQYDTALILFNKSLELSTEIDFSDCKIRATNGIANVYFQYGNHAKALEYYLTALKISEHNKYHRGKSVALNNIGLIYAEQKKTQKAIEYYEQSMAISSEIKDTTLYMATLNNIGNIQYKLSNYHESLNIHYEALTYFINHNTNQHIAETHIYLGNNYLQLNDFDKAERNYQQALTHAKESKGIEPQCAAILGISKVLFNKNEYNDALKWANEGLLVSKIATHGMLLRDYYFLLSQIHEKLNNNLLAYNSFKEYHIHSEGIFNSEIEKKTAFLDAQYEFEKKEDQLISEQIFQNLIHKQEVSYWRFAFIIGLILLLFTTSSIVFIFRSKIRLKNTNNELEKANSEIDKHRTELLQLNATKDKFFSIIAHDLKSPFNSILGLSSILKNEIIYNDSNKALQLAESLNKTSTRVYNLLENLLLWAKTQTGKFDFNPIRFNLRLLAKEVVELLEETAISKKIQIKIEIHSSIIVNADRPMIATVLRNLISNAIKFTPEKGYIFVSSETENNKIRVSVIDNGKGISEENIKKLFRIEETYTTKGTINEEGSGLGLLICKEFIDLHRSDIYVESEEDKGSRFSFTISTLSNV